MKKMYFGLAIVALSIIWFASALANPASVKCVNDWWVSTIQTDGSGNQYGICTLKNWIVCEERAYYRGECGSSSTGTIMTWSTGMMVGNDKDSHGCIWSAGYVWNTWMNQCVRPWEVSTGIIATGMIVGNDKDSHGCIWSAGYSWDAKSQKCIRPRENNSTKPVVDTKKATVKKVLVTKTVCNKVKWKKVCKKVKVWVVKK